MKKSFLQHSYAQKIAGIITLALIVLLFLWLSKDSSVAQTTTRDTLNPFFRFTGFVRDIFTFSEDFKNLEKEKKELEVRNSLLEAKVSEFESLLNFPAPNRLDGKIALVSSQSPATPYGTLLVSFDSSQDISAGMKAIAYDGIYLGEVSEVGGKSAVVKLISFPERETEAWLERLSLNITLQGQGSNNLKFSLPKSIKVEVGDKIISNTTPQYLIGQIEFIEDRPTEPLQEILLRLPFNFRNLRHVKLVP